MSTTSPASPAPTIDRARRSDLDGIRWLLDIEELPSVDITEDALEHFLVCRDATGVAGVVGLEVYSEVALLRSLVVTTGCIGRGLGRRLMAAAEERAIELNIRSIYLLTTTAQTFFEHMGVSWCCARGGAAGNSKHAGVHVLVSYDGRPNGEAMNNRFYHVLLLCTGNSARSILAEAILSDRGRGVFRAFSAGSHQKGALHPQALALLEREGHSTEGLRSNAWGKFAEPGSPAMDFVFTVCDNATGEVCPVWPGQPILAHWGSAGSCCDGRH